jgi:hypothetical protein
MAMKNAAPTNPRTRRREAESMLSDPLGVYLDSGGNYARTADALII